MSFPANTPLTTPEIKSIGKMLLCAWSAEYHQNQREAIGKGSEVFDAT